MPKAVVSRPPSFFDASKVGQRRRPRFDLVIDEGLRAKATPASRDQPGHRIAWVDIDDQNGFVQPDGGLPVPGAIEDLGRSMDAYYRNWRKITTTILTGDKHPALMINWKSWWWAAKDFEDTMMGHTYRTGDRPIDFTIISEESILNGLWEALYPEWSLAYPTKLARKGKKPLVIWPYHCLDNTDDANFATEVYEGALFLAAARTSQPIMLHKGHIPFTDFFGPLRPEIDIPNVPGGTLNTDILNVLAEHDRIIIKGQAKSHCVLEFMNQLEEYFAREAKTPDVLKKVTFLIDGTSSVKHPAIDFDALANTRLAELEATYGIQLVKCADLDL